MISIGFSTRDINSSNKFIEKLKKSSTLKNVEIIPFINNGSVSLSSAYNEIIDKSTNDILVLCHDDVLMSNGWDKKLLKSFNETNYGILGLAGTTDLDSNGVWWSSNHRMVGNVHHVNDGKKYLSKYCANLGDKIAEVCLVDGLFIALNKKRIKSKFNTDFDGFHFYDIPFCVDNYLNGVEIGVLFNFEITHLSIGQTNQKWEENRIKFVEKYSNVLPLSHKPKNNIEVKEIKKHIKKEVKASVIIPNKDKFDLLSKCLNSFRDNVNYKNYEIIIADTGSSYENKENIKSYVKNSNLNIKLIEYDYYNFAKINNDVVSNHISEDTEFLIFCNNDIILMNDVVSEYLNVYLKNKFSLGTIGCRLYYEDGTIQHEGIQMLLNKNNNLLLGHIGLKSYYPHINTLMMDTIGNTGALMGTPRLLFDRLGGFVETSECFEDVIYNINCICERKVNFFSSEAQAWHYESQTRNMDSKKEERQREDFVNILIPYFNKSISNPRFSKKIKILN